MNYKSIFKNFGLSKEHADIYSALVEGGRMRIAKLAKDTNIPRTTCYEYLPDLLEHKLVEEVEEGKSKFYQITSPQYLVSRMHKIRNEVSYNLSTLESGFDELVEKYNLRQSPYFVEAIDSFYELKKLMFAFSKLRDVVVITPDEVDEKLTSEFGNLWDKLVSKPNSLRTNFADDTLRLITRDVTLVVSLEKKAGILVQSKS